MIADRREGIGMFLVGIGFFWMMGVAGTDDYNTAMHIFTPMLPLVIKSVFGLLVIGSGVMLVDMKGGEDNEDFASLPDDEAAEISRFMRGDSEI